VSVPPQTILVAPCPRNYMGQNSLGNKQTWRTLPGTCITSIHSPALLLQGRSSQRPDALISALVVSEGCGRVKSKREKEQAARRSRTSGSDERQAAHRRNASTRRFSLLSDRLGLSHPEVIAELEQ
jgi:hypothetical protein